MATIKDLSIKCGVSVSTISKALNGYQDISEATREKVMKAANDSEIVKAQKANPKVDVFTGLKFKNEENI